MNKRLVKIRTKWSDARLLSLPGVPASLEPDFLFDVVVSSDRSVNKKAVEWLLGAWESGGFLWEDIRAGTESQISQTLFDFERLKNRIVTPEGTPDIPARSLMKYKSPGELWTSIRHILEQEEETGLTITGREDKRLDAMKARLETSTHILPSGLKVEIPMTRAASRFLGHNTKWCTASTQDNMFDEYARQGPLMVFTLPCGTRFQAHAAIHTDTSDEYTRYGLKDKMETIFSDEFVEDDNDKESQEIPDESFGASIELKENISFMNEADMAPNKEEQDILRPYQEDISRFMAKSIVTISEMEDYNGLEDSLCRSLGFVFETSAPVIRPHIPAQPEIENTQEEPVRDILRIFLDAGLIERHGKVYRINPDAHITSMEYAIDDAFRDFFDNPEYAHNNITFSSMEEQKFCEEMSKLVLTKEDISKIRSIPRGHRNLFEKMSIQAPYPVVAKAFSAAMFNEQNIGAYAQQTLDKYGEDDKTRRKLIIERDFFVGGRTERYFSKGARDVRFLALSNYFPELTEDIKSRSYRIWAESSVSGQMPEDTSRFFKTVLDRNKTADTEKDMNIAINSITRTYLENFDVVYYRLSDAQDMVDILKRGDVGISVLIDKIQEVSFIGRIEAALIARETISAAIFANVSSTEYLSVMSKLDTIFQSHASGLLDIVRYTNEFLTASDTSQKASEPYVSYAVRYLYSHGKELSSVLDKFPRSIRKAMSLLSDSHDNTFITPRDIYGITVTEGPHVFVDDALYIQDHNLSGTQSLKQKVYASSLFQYPDKDFLEAIGKEYPDPKEILSLVLVENSRVNAVLSRIHDMPDTLDVSPRWKKKIAGIMRKHQAISDKIQNILSGKDKIQESSHPITGGFPEHSL